MSQQKKKSNFLKREVKFCGKTVVLYSIDGNTWSTRKEELQAIIDRHESEKITFGEIKGGLGAGAKPVAAKKEEVVDEKILKVKPEAEDEEEIDDLNMIVEDDLDLVEDEAEEGKKPTGKRGRPSIAVAKSSVATAKAAPASAKLKSVEKSVAAPVAKGKAAKPAPKKKEAVKAKVAAPKARTSGVPAKSKSKPKSKKAAA